MNTEIILISLAVMIIPMFLGLPVAFSLTLGGMTALFLFVGAKGLIVGPTVMLNTVIDFTWTALPLFVLMGAIIAKGGISDKLFNLFNVFLGHIPGGVGIATILTCALLSAMCGSSPAVAAMVGTFAIAELRKYGYSEALSVGIVGGGGALGILIPPSIPMIVYGSMAGVSVGDLFLAGYLPGLLAVVLFCIYTMFAYRRSGKYQVAAKTTGREKWIALKKGLPGVSIPLGTMIVLYTGLATPTEIAALSCIWAYIVGAFIYKTISWKSWKDISRIAGEGLATTGMILIIVCGAMIFGNAITQMGVPGAINDFFLSHNMPSQIFLLIIMVIVIIMGCFLDGASIMLIMVPLITLTLVTYKMDLLVFGILLVINIEIGMLTPPVGLNLYVINGVLKNYGLSGNINTCIRGCFPFVLLYALAMLLVAVFPDIATFLPLSLRA